MVLTYVKPIKFDVIDNVWPYFKLSKCQTLGHHYSIMGHGSLIVNACIKLKFILKTTKKSKKPYMFTDR